MEGENPNPGLLERTSECENDDANRRVKEKALLKHIHMCYTQPSLDESGFVVPRRSQTDQRPPTAASAFGLNLRASLPVGSPNFFLTNRLSPSNRRLALEAGWETAKMSDCVVFLYFIKQVVKKQLFPSIFPSNKQDNGWRINCFSFRG